MWKEGRMAVRLRAGFRHEWVDGWHSCHQIQRTQGKNKWLRSIRGNKRSVRALYICSTSRTGSGTRREELSREDEAIDRGNLWPPNIWHSMIICHSKLASHSIMWPYCFPMMIGHVLESSIMFSSYKWVQIWKSKSINNGNTNIISNLFQL